ncbi:MULTISPECIES: hypothetical protein [Streptomyces]|uniref:hypothetical protein n=1 Tax=Streptomyces TaxID=1883 RepID=UPI00068E1DEC|nr:MULTISPECIES: hypothetical protein [Streptomyces]
MVAATGSGAAFTDLAAKDGPQARRALYLHALACAMGSPGADARRLLDQVDTALAAEHGQRFKPWQRAMLLAFEAIARSALGLPEAAGRIEEFERVQSPDGSFFGMPLVTGILHLALNRTAPGHRVTLRARESLLADQHPDGTWRFLVSEVWDTGLLVRSLRGDRHFDQGALPAALTFLVRAQNPDGGWPCTAVLDSDNDTTGNTLLALAGTAEADRVRAAATRYARRHQTRDGLWHIWLAHDDTPAPDVVAHMVAGIEAAALPGIELARPVAGSPPSAPKDTGTATGTYPRPTARPRSAPPRTRTPRTAPPWRPSSPRSAPTAAGPASRASRTPAPPPPAWPSPRSPPTAATSPTPPPPWSGPCVFSSTPRPTTAPGATGPSCPAPARS